MATADDGAQRMHLHPESVSILTNFLQSSDRNAIRRLVNVTELADPNFKYFPGPPVRPPKFPSQQEWQTDIALRNELGAYASLMKLRQKLPAWGYRAEVLHAVKHHQVTVVSGETGCGKSTQVPQFLLVSDEWQLGGLRPRPPVVIRCITVSLPVTAPQDDTDIGPRCNIIVTQPRRLSAMALAERVAEERCEPVGQTVGFNVRLNACTR